ncbi:MAG: alpha/beta fold hydrolase [bacterium]
MGCRVLCFDAPGHGLSQGKYINIVIYQEAIQEIIKDHGPIDYFIGHSLGAITLAMVAETISHPQNHKFVLIAPATKTTTVIIINRLLNWKFIIQRMMQRVSVSR